MEVRTIALTIVCLALAEPALAQSAMPAVAPPVKDVRLLDEVPDFAAALRSQWSGEDVPPGTAPFATDVTHYGRLRELTAPRPLTIADAVALALANNTGLQISRLGPLGARTQVRLAQSIFDPALFADADYARTRTPSASFLAPERPLTPGEELLFGPTLALLGPQFSVTRRTNADGGIRKLLLSGGQLSLAWRNTRLVSNSPFNSLHPQYTTDFALSLNQPLLRDFGLSFTTLQIRIARTAEQSALKQYEAAIANTIKEVEQAYWTVVLAETNVTVQEQGLALAKELQRQNEGKFNVGAAPRTAVLEAQTEVARRETNLIQAQNARTISRDTLRAVINAESPETTSLLVFAPVDTPKVEPYAIDLDRSLSAALAQRPELAAAKLNVQGSSMQLKVAENQLLPRLNAVGAVGTNGLSGGKLVRQQQISDPNNPTAPPATITLINPFNGDYDSALNRAVGGNFYSYSAGVTLEVPLDNAQARAEYAQGRVNLERSRLGLQQLQENVTLEVKRAVSNLESDLKSVDATRIARELAEDNLHNQQARYDVGLATTKDLLDFQDRLTQARAAEVQALTAYRTDLAELRRVEGSLLAAHNVVLTTNDEEPAPWWARF
jgi:outer membrane protein